MELARINGRNFIDSIIDKETGEMMEPSMEVLKSTNVIPFMSAIFAALAKQSKVVLVWEEICDEYGNPSDGILSAAAEDDDEIMEIANMISTEFETAIAERFAQKEIEDE